MKKLFRTLILLSMAIIHRITVVLALPKDIDDLIVALYRIHDSMASSPYFAGLAAKLLAFKAKIDKLKDYHIAAHTTPPTKTTAERDEAKQEAINDAEILRNDVQNIVNAAPPADGETIATAAGMKVKRIGAVNKQDFSVKHGEVSGSIFLVAKAVETSHAAHEWRMSLDGNAWTYITTTLQASTTVSGLNPGTKVLFQHRTILKDGPTDWSQDEAIIVN